MSLLLLEHASEPGGHRLNAIERVSDRLHAARLGAEVALGAAAALRRRVAVAGRDEIFVFESLERDQHRGARRLASSAARDVGEAHGRKQDKQLEFAEGGGTQARRHLDYIVIIKKVTRKRGYEETRKT